jgi:hypothetical protein
MMEADRPLDRRRPAAPVWGEEGFREWRRVMAGPVEGRCAGNLTLPRVMTKVRVGGNLRRREALWLTDR